MSDNGLYKTALYYGSLSGIAVFLFYIVLYFSGLNIFGPASILGIWIPVVFLVKATRFYRDHNLGGTMTYGQGFTIGFFTTAFSVTLFGLSFYLFGMLFAGDLLELYRNAAAASEEAGRSVFSDELIDKTMEGVDLVTMATLAYSESFIKLVGGVAATLMIAALFRRKPQSSVPL